MFFSTSPGDEEKEPDDCNDDEEKRATIMRDRTDRLLDESLNLYPLGEMSVEDFEDMEEACNWWCNVTTSHLHKQSEESVEKSLLLYKRLVEEHQTNPAILEMDGMAHWLSGNYPRSLLLLRRIVNSWRYYWMVRGAAVAPFTPIQILAFVDQIAGFVSESESKNVSPTAAPPTKTTTRLLPQEEEGGGESNNATLRVPINNEIYTIIMRAAIQSHWDASETAVFVQNVLDHMVQVAKEKNNPAINPDVVTFSTVMDAWAKSGRQDAPQRADALLQKMIQLYEDGQIDEPPNTYTYVSVMQAWNNCTKYCDESGESTSTVKSKRDKAERIEQLLHEMMYNTSFAHLVPDTNSFRLAIHSWATCPLKERDAPHRAHSILKEIILLHEAGSNNVQLDSDFFSVVIKSYADRRMWKEAEEVFHLQQQLYTMYSNNASAKDDYNERIKPDDKVLRAMIVAYSHSNRPENAQKAEDLLMHLQQLAEQTGQQHFLPKRSYFSDVIHAWCNVNDKDTTMMFSHKSNDRTNSNAPPYRAEHIFLSLVRLYLSSGDENWLPDKYLFHKIIINWAAHANKIIDAPERAEAILRIMQDIYIKTQHNKDTSNDGNSVGSDTKGATTANKSSTNTSSGSSKSNRRFDKVNNIKPDEETFFHVLVAWSRSKLKKAPERAGKLFFELQERYNNGMIGIDTNSNPKDGNTIGKDVDLKPTRLHYTTLLMAYVRHNHPDSGRVAQFVLNEVIKEYNESGDEDLKPNKKLYGALINAFAKMGDVKNAEALLLQMIEEYNINPDRDVQPDCLIFNRVLETWYKVLLSSTRREQGNVMTTATAQRYNKQQTNTRMELGDSAVDRAEFIFKNMKELASKGILDVEPDGFTYQFMTFIWAQQTKYDNGLEQAEKYLQLMKSTIENKNCSNVHKTNQKHQIQPRPGYFESYTKVISAWLRKNDNGGVNSTKAEQLLNELSELIKLGKVSPPQSKSYVPFLKIIANSTIPEKSKRAKSALKENDFIIKPSLGLLPKK